MSPRGVPKRRTISIHCRACRTLLYKYAKGGTGSLVKCHVERILEDFIGGKTYTKGMTRKQGQALIACLSSHRNGVSPQTLFAVIR